MGGGIQQRGHVNAGPAPVQVCQRCHKQHGPFRANVFPEGFYCDACYPVVKQAPNRKVADAYNRRMFARRAAQLAAALKDTAKQTTALADAMTAMKDTLTTEQTDA